MIKTEKDWWDNVYLYWNDFQIIFSKYLPTEEHEDIDGMIIVSPLWLHIEGLKEKKDKTLGRYFQAAWAASPDCPSIHDNRSWSKLCDLCSEDYVLYENEDTK
jgi:hypothetical protein